MSNLTSSQQQLADLLLNTKIEAKVIKRLKKDDGTYYLEESKRPTSPIDFAQSEEEFALKVHEVNINAPLSPVYVNLRNLPENVLQKIGEVLSEVKLDSPQDYCTGVPKAALVIAEKFSEVSKTPFLDVFDKVGANTERKIVIKEGMSPTPDTKLLVIDDVIAHGKSKLEALEAAKTVGFYVNMLVLIDREQGGVQQVEKEGCRVYAAMKLTDILEYYFEKEMITKKQYENSIAYLTT
jgi:orotate phosphoribosyltransferase